MKEGVLSTEEENRYAELQALALDYARQGATEELRAMLEAGLPVNLSDHKEQSLLMLAAYYDHVATVEMLIEFGAELDRRNSHGQTPLAGAAFKGHLASVKALVEAGADFNADHGKGMTPISFAAMFGRKEVLDYFKSCGAQMGIKNHLFAIPGRVLKHIV